MIMSFITSLVVAAGVAVRQPRGALVLPATRPNDVAEAIRRKRLIENAGLPVIRARANETLAGQRGPLAPWPDAAQACVR